MFEASSKVTSLVHNDAVAIHVATDARQPKAGENGKVGILERLRYNVRMNPFDALYEAQRAALQITRRELLKKREKLMARLEEINRELAEGEDDEGERE